MRTKLLVVIAALAVALAGCGSAAGPTSPGGNATAAPGATEAGGGSAPPVLFSLATVKLPFGGDVCQSLMAADFASLPGLPTGWTLTKTELIGGIGGPNTTCLYDLKSKAGGGAQPGVGYENVDGWDLDKQVASKDASYKAVAGVGDDAYLVNALGQNVLYIKAKGYRIVITGVGAFNDPATLKVLAGAVLGRI